MVPPAPRPWSVWLVQVLALASGYWITGRLGLLLAIPPGYATAVWPPSGIALGGMLLFGPRIWPGVWLGSFLVNAGNAFDPGSPPLTPALLVAAVIGLGASLQAVCGAWLIRRVGAYPGPLGREGDVLRFLVLGGPVSCLVNATWGISILWISGMIQSDEIFFSWWTWWAGDAIGAFSVAPVLLLWLGEPRDLMHRRRLPVGVPLLAAFSLAIVLFVVARHWEQQRLEREFHWRVDTMVEALDTRLTHSLDALHDLKSYHLVDPEAFPRLFRGLARGLLDRRAGISSLSWNPRVTSTQRPLFEQQLRQLHGPGFVIRELDPSGRRIPAAPRAEYFPILQLEPREGHEAAIGFDVNSEKIRREALHRARVGGRTTATGPLRLIQGRSEDRAILVFNPIFHPNDPGTPDRGIAGVVVLVQRLEPLLEATWPRFAHLGIACRIVDTSLEGRPVPLATWNTGGLGESEPGVIASRQVTVSLADRTWQLEFTPTRTFLQEHRSLQAWTVLAGGVIFSGLLGAFLLVVTGRTASVEQLVAERTRDLGRANTALQASEQTLRSTLSSLDDVVFVLDPGRRFLEFYQSPNQRSLLVPPDRFLGRTIEEVLPSDVCQALEGAIATLERSGQVQGFDYQLTLPTLGRRWFSARVSQRYDEGGRFAGVTIVSRDITDRKSQEEELRRTRDAAEAASRAKSEFLANVSHELRTPLNGIVGMVDLILESVLENNLRRQLQVVQTSSETLLRVICDLLDFSRIDAGQLLLEPRRFAPRRELTATLEPLRDQAERKGLKFRLEIAPEVPAHLMGDPERLCQILVNLVGNAIKFTSTGEVVVTVGLQTGRWDDSTLASRFSDPSHPIPPSTVSPSDLCTLQFEVRDTGIGIPPDKLQAIFEPFTQADMSTTRRHGGTGLGLSIANRLVRLMGGTLEVNSVVGIGSTVRFAVPLALVPEQPGAIVHPEEILERFAGGLEILQQAIVLFRGRYPHLLEQLRGAVGARRQPELRGPAHELAGMLMIFNGERATQLARQLERLGPDPSWPTAERLLNDLELALADLDAALDHLDQPT